ncbi:MAG: DUF3344 domain-containing protein [Halobacteriota archaeon]
MKNKIVLFSVLTVFALFAVIAVPSVSATYPANAIYLNPEDSSGLYCENNTLVEVRVNASVVTTGVQTDIYFDPTCVNITDVDYTGSAWPPLAPPGWRHFGDHVRLIGTNFAGAPAGDNLFATIRLHCVNEGCCISDLEFSGVSVPDSTGTPIDITAYNGTFTCESPEKPDLVIEDKWEEWLNETHYNVTYVIHNNGTAIAPASHNTTLYVDGVPIEHKHVPVALAPCETYTDTFDTVIECTGDSDTIKVCADNYNVTDELDETNNCLENEWICKEKKPDLNVTEITVNYDASSLGGRAIGPVPGPDVHTECNNLSAVIKEENEVDVGSPFNVTFEVDGTTLCTVRVPSLTGGANKTVYCNCSWYPYAGNAFAINVTVDSNNEIPESDETNNTKWNNGIVVSNGYKGDGWQGPDMNLINEQCHKQDTINLTYSVGDSRYVSGSTLWTEYIANWTTDDLPVPAGADIEKAMLYVYYTWDKNDVMPDNVNMVFNGNNIALARHYSDRKGFGGYDYPSGMLVYNVTSHFTATGPNNAILTKAVAADEVSMRGMLLMVVYKHPDEPKRIIYIDEGYDMLYAKESYAVTSEEATTYAPFTRCEPVPVEELGKATLIAVAPSAKDGDDKNRLSFNDGLWKGIWDHYEADTQLGIAVADVSAYLKATENRANFQSHIPAGEDKGDFMDASNAFLILEKSKQHPLWHEINEELDALISNVSAADMPNIIKRRLIDKLEYAKRLKENAKVVCEEGNFAGATKKLGVAKSQVESFASMVKITRRISSADKASFLADSTEIKGEIEALIEYIETEHSC